MNLTPEDREIGRDNYYNALAVSRREFLQGTLAAGVTSTAGLGAMYFGYDNTVGGDPVRVGVIGTGDEGNVLIGAMNPEYVQVTAIADIRPSSIYRAFHGDWSSPAAIAARPGLMSVYGWKTREEADKNVTVYTDYKELIQNKDIEAVVIALPLHLHAPVAIAAMQAGKHVLTEKLMAHNVAQCKLMGRVAKETGLHLATGHQRHYSVLYDNAVNLLRWGLLGQVHHIRAQWHRGNLPWRDSWSPPIPGGEMGFDPKTGKMDKNYDRILGTLNGYRKQVIDLTKDPLRADPKRLAELERLIPQWEAWDQDKTVAATEFGYQDLKLPDGYNRTALEELIRWRLWERTGGGLMAELGSHQLDAASIFISALRDDGKKVHPLTVHAVGGRHIFPPDRDAEDHVYCMYEFPGPEYEPGFEPGYYDPTKNFPDPKQGIQPYSENPNRKIVVTYSTINGNGFGGYGETVMGTKGTLILEKEAEVMLYKDADTKTTVSVKDDGGGPTLDTQASGAPGAVAKAAEGTGPVSRGYREEIEHWAWCIRNPAPENFPRCKPEVALGDAVIALATNVALKNANQGKGGFLKFEEAWYDLDNDATPDGSRIEAEKSAIG